MDLRTTRSSVKSSDISAGTSHSLSALFYWTAAAAFLLMFYLGSPSKRISLIRIDWKGDIVSVAGATGYSANPFRVRGQLETRENPAQRNDFCRSIITQKIEASILTLEKSIPRSDKWERAMKSAYAALCLKKIRPRPFRSSALEGNWAAAYFRSWVGVPIKWRGTSRRPIPDNWRAIGPRSSPFHLAGNRNAAHPVNAILNYAYAALESEIRIRAISEGYDPDAWNYARGQRWIVEIHFRFNGAGAPQD
jgi:CRISP-associated protein Cas1